MTKITAYLFFNGNCAEAMRFYEGVLGGKLEMMKFGDGPPDVCPEGAADRVMHACLTTVDGQSLMASDVMPGQPDQGHKGFAVSLGFPTAAEAKRAFDALADGGKVAMPLDKTFWTEAFGMLTDRFGVEWMIGGGQQK